MMPASTRSPNGVARWRGRPGAQSDFHREGPAHAADEPAVDDIRIDLAGPSLRQGWCNKRVPGLAPAIEETTLLVLPPGGHGDGGQSRPGQPIVACRRAGGDDGEWRGGGRG